jgi:hypothetical protein
MAKIGPAIQGPITLSLSIADQKVPVTLVDETDTATLEAGVSSPTIQLSKNGASYGSLSDGTWAEIGNGDYTVKLNGTDTNTAGWAILRVIKAGTSAEAKVLLWIGTSPVDMRDSLVRTRTLIRRG